MKEVDEQGRVVIPKEWREKILRDGKVVMRLTKDSIEIRPYRQEDLTKFFGTVVVDVESSLEDWHSLRKELRGRNR